MVQRVGIELHAGRTSGQGALDGAVEQPGADALADVTRREAEEGDLVVLQLEVTDEVVVVTRDMDLVSFLSEHVRQRRVGQQPPLEPQPRPADSIVKLAIEGDAG